MHIKPKKALGQNFLTDKNVLRKLVASYCFKPDERILEIGAGYGELTKLIADRVAFVYAVEIDAGLCKALSENTEALANIKIINRDILRFNLKKYFARIKNKIKVVGNIPYYITTPIIENLFKYRDRVESIFITVQKEFAKRIVAKAGSKEYGSFSCFVQYYTIPKILFLIKKGSFSPVPKVDSCLLELKIREAPAVDVKDEKLFFKVIRASFNKRRKTLRNSLEDIVPLEKLVHFFDKYHIDSNIRPEDLTLQDFAHLADIIKKVKKD